MTFIRSYWLVYICDDGNFLAVDAPLEKDLGRVLGIVGGKKLGQVLSHCIGSRTTLGLYELVKNLIE